MKRNKLWYLNQKEQLYPLLSNESLYHHIDKIKKDASVTTGASIVNLNEKYNHYILTESKKYINTDAKQLNMNALYDLSHKNQSIAQLKLYGLHTHQQLPDERLFLFRMLHLKALVWSRVNQKFNIIGKANVVERNSADLIIQHDEQLSEIIIRQAEIVAGRALYAAGLDIGSVLLAISGTGTIAVRSVYPIYDVLNVQDESEINQALRLWLLNKARLQKRIDSTYNTFSQQQLKPIPRKNSLSAPLLVHKSFMKLNEKKQNNRENNNEPLNKEDEWVTYERKYEQYLYDQDDELWLGADPELIFVNGKDEIIPAIEVLTDDHLGRYGFDSIITQQKVTFPVAEVRPEPKRTPQELFAEIESILDEMNQYGIHGQYKWLAGGMPKGIIPLGGHLHFSGVALSSRLLNVLDACLALPFSLVEDKSSTELRRPKYGALGDYRRQDHGGFEYRTLPSWLVTPNMTRAALALGYIVVKEERTLYHALKLDSSLFVEYHKGNIALVREHAKYLFNVLETLESYKEVEEWIAPLKYMIQVGKRWNEAEDIKQMWQLAVYH